LPDFSRLARYLFPLTMTLDVEPEGWYLGSRSPLGSGFLLGFAGSAGVSLYAAPGAPTVAQRTMSRAVTSEDAWKRANLALGEGKGTEALRHYSQALQLAESDRHKGALYFERGRLLAELGDDSQAIGDFDRAANLGHAPGESHFLAAAAHARQGEAAEAVSRLRRAIEAGWRQYDDLSRDRSFVTIARDPRYRTFLRSLDR